MRTGRVFTDEGRNAPIGFNEQLACGEERTVSAFFDYVEWASACVAQKKWAGAVMVSGGSHSTSAFTAYSMGPFTRVPNPQ